MEKVVMKASRTDSGYCCACDLIPGWVVPIQAALTGSRIMCRKASTSTSRDEKKMAEAILPFLTGNMKWYMISMWQHCLIITVEYSRSLPCRQSQASTRSSSHTMPVASPRHVRSRLKKSRRGFAVLPKI